MRAAKVAFFVNQSLNDLIWRAECRPIIMRCRRVSTSSNQAQRLRTSPFTPRTTLPTNPTCTTCLQLRCYQPPLLSFGTTACRRARLFWWSQALHKGLVAAGWRSSSFSPRLRPPRGSPAPALLLCMRATSTPIWLSQPLQELYLLIRSSLFRL
jgi:hypothetical protein